MRIISISDVSLKHDRTPGGTQLSFREKIELAKLLDRLGVSVIETGPIVSRKADSLLIKSLASAIRSSTLAVPVTLLDPESVALTWAALPEAVKPRLQVAAPVSTVQMEYFCHKKPSAMLEIISDMVRRCREVCEDVEFVAEDAGRSEPEFLKQDIDAAVEAGAGIVTVCDTAGTLLPEEFYGSVKIIRDSVPESIHLGVQCSNELYIADACAIAAVRAGADEVKTSSSGEYTACLEKFAHLLAVKGADHNISCAVRTTELSRTVGQIRRMCQTQNGKSAYDSSVHDEAEGAVLTIHDDRDAVIKAVAAIGYDLSDEDEAKVYEAFVRIASKKESVGVKELDAIVASAALQVPPTYVIESYVVNSGNLIGATSKIRMKKSEQSLEGLASGDGPIDASFFAIDNIVGRHYELDDFQIQAVTEGRDSMGETVVRLRASSGKLYSGRGISTDIIGASIRAYVNAVNKIVYEEGEA